MNPTFQDSFDDVHLLYEVRQIYLFEVQNQQIDLNNEHVFVLLFHLLDPAGWRTL